MEGFCAACGRGRPEEDIAVCATGDKEGGVVGKMEEENAFDEICVSVGVLDRWKGGRAGFGVETELPYRLVPAAGEYRVVWTKTETSQGCRWSSEDFGDGSIFDGYPLYCAGGFSHEDEAGVCRVRFDGCEFRG